MEQATQERTERLIATYAAAAALHDLRSRQAAQSLWAGFAEWYSASAVTDLAAQSAALSTTSQQMSAGLAQQYAQQLVGLMRGPGGTRLAPPKALHLPAVRNGADLLEVYERPAAKYRREFAFTGDPAKAEGAALSRVQDLIETDQILVRREATQQTFKSLGVRFLRRVIHPELSQSGTCGLCAVAATRIYKVEELMSLHPPFCKCTSAPVMAGDDPGKTLNEKDLKAIYDEAGGTSAAVLKRIRIRQHGEHGPVLVDADHKFSAPREAKVPFEDDPIAAVRLLAAQHPHLLALEQREAAGEDVTGPLRYQRGLIARLEAIATK